MKLKEDFVLRQVADTWVVLPLGAATVDFNGMLTLNETGAFLWQRLQAGADADALVSALTAEYDVTPAQAAADVDAFCRRLLEVGCAEN
jgi:hypothetical protein